MFDPGLLIKRIWFRVVYGTSRNLRDYESASLRRIRDNLDTGAAAVLDAQLAALGVIQRFSNDKMVMFHFLPGESYPLFDSDSDELRLACLHLQDAGRNRSRVDLVLHRGRLSSLEYSRQPKPLADGSIQAGGIEIVRLPVTEDRPGQPQSRPMLERLRSKLKLSEVHGPASEAKVRRLVADLSCGLPPDFLELLRETDGFLANGWEFYGTRARRLVLPEVNLWIVAEADTQALCFQEERAEPVVSAYSHEDDEAHDFDTKSFFDAFLAVATGNPAVDH